MNIAEFQSRLINELDKVVAGAEALMMAENARTKADFERLKTEIQGLLDVVTDFERLCFGEKENSLQSVQETLAARKRTGAESPEDEPERPAPTVTAILE